MFRRNISYKKKKECRLLYRSRRAIHINLCVVISAKSFTSIFVARFNTRIYDCYPFGSESIFVTLLRRITKTTLLDGASQYTENIPGRHRTPTKESSLKCTGTCLRHVIYIRVKDKEYHISLA